MSAKTFAFRPLRAESTPAHLDKPGAAPFRLRHPWFYAALLLAPAALPLLAHAQGDTTRVSVASDGQEANEISFASALSADGRYVAFRSDASNLVPGDANGVPDIFVHNRQTHETTRVSVASDGRQGYDVSDSPSLSADGRYVAFTSQATNLVPGDTNGVGDVFVHDRQTHETTRISVASDGQQASSGEYRRGSYAPSLSADGRYVAFASLATNLVPGDTNGEDRFDSGTDVFVHDRQTHQTTRISLDSNGHEANSYSSSPSISADGRYVSFVSSASNLVTGDTNGVVDIFVHDRQTHQTTRVSVASDGREADGRYRSGETSISADGRYVAFTSQASNLVPGDTNGWDDIFVHDRQTHQTTRVSVASDGQESYGYLYNLHPSISADGRYVAFVSLANNLVPGDTNIGYCYRGGCNGFDVFVHDRQTRQTTWVSAVPDGQEFVYGSVSRPSISADGRYVAFDSSADVLVPGDTNGGYPSGRDIFVRDRLLLPAKKADVVLTQRDSADPVHKGGSLSYTVTVKNKGPGPAYYVNLTDLVPQNAQLLSVTTSQGFCYKAPVTVCRLGNLAAGAQATVKVNLKATQLGVVSNTVSVSAAPVDLAPDNNRSTARTWIIN